MAYVLCTGPDSGLVATRQLILESAGHTAMAAHTEPEIVKACELLEFDVVVIGQGNDPQFKHHYMEVIRRHCASAKILEVYLPAHGIDLSDADDWLESPAIPRELADRVAKLAGAKRLAEKERRTSPTKPGTSA